MLQPQLDEDASWRLLRSSICQVDLLFKIERRGKGRSPVEGEGGTGSR